MTRAKNAFYFFTIMFLFTLTIVLRGGYVQWIANRAMLLWTDQLVNRTDSHRITTPAASSPFSMPPAAMLAFGRINFAQNDYQEAVAFFERAYHRDRMTPHALAELAVALSREERFADVIALYEARHDQLGQSSEARDAILVAYLHQLKVTSRVDAEVLSTLQKLASDQFYIKYLTLLHQFNVEQVSALPDAAKKELAQFPLVAIVSDDERLLAYSARILPDLVESGVWDIDTLVNVIRLWIRQYPDYQGIDHLIQTASMQFSEEFDWSTVKSELDLRRDFRNGQVDIIHTTSNQVANLLPNGGFDTMDYRGLVGWRVADYITGDTSGALQAAFSMDVDEAINITPPFALRLDGVWEDNPTGFYGAVAVGSSNEGTYLLTLSPNVAYQISGYYRTEGYSEQVSIYVGKPELTLLEADLPATSHTWQAFEFIACHSAERTESMQILLRLHGIGTVWFDDMVVQPANEISSSNDCP